MIWQATEIPRYGCQHPAWNDVGGDVCASAPSVCPVCGDRINSHAVLLCEAATDYFEGGVVVGWVGEAGAGIAEETFEG